MGVLEILLIIAVALKMAGVAFAGTTYLALVGYYVVGVVVTIASLFAAVQTVRLLTK